MPTLTIDGREITVEPGTTVLQACELAGKEIPRFCYHERLSIAGNCRMCLVEMERSPKPIASCAMPAGDGMVIHTDTPGVKRAREGVMEFLLINHPLDCPICDQGGECDLQDQAMAYGRDRSRFHEHKRAVEDKDFGPLIKTFMTRCIHCTRCVRFMSEVAGVPELGALNRGEDMEIASVIARGLGSELSGNIIDLCPVGALTSKPYAFSARSWELRKTESIDVLDAVGSNIRVDSRGRQVMRILPRLNEAVNEEWISDKTRFAYDGLRHQRLDRPYLREADGRLRPASWQEAFAGIARRLDGLTGDRFGAIAGDLADCESMCALKDLTAALGSPNIDCRQDGARLRAAPRVSYLFNTTIAGIDAADACLLVGTNPRLEAPIINQRIRRRWLAGGLRIGVIGERADLTYGTDHLGAGPATLAEVAGGAHDFCAALDKAERPMIVLGMGALAHPDGGVVLGLARALAERFGLVGEDWNGFNVLHTAAARVGGLDLGLVPGDGGLDVAGMVQAAGRGDLDVLYLLGADEIDTGALGRAFVVYQGHHGDRGAQRADVVLPGAAYTEKSATYVNTEGRAQRTRLAVFPPGDAREDWAILRALSGALGRPLPYDSIAALRARMAEQSPHLNGLDQVARATRAPFGSEGAYDQAPFASPIANFYMTDPIGRASETMAQCSAAFAPRLARTGTGG
ncbi:MAG TPA: NADH-quinone oxidoreductase subunit NuoG [Alphaproteobacteria bacterium]